MNYNEEKLSRLHFCFCIFSFMSPSFFIIEIKRNFDRKNLWKYQKNPSISQKGVPPQDPYFLKNGQINRVTKFSSSSRPTESDSKKKGPIHFHAISNAISSPRIKNRGPEGGLPFDLNINQEVAPTLQTIWNYSENFANLNGNK